MHPQGARDGRRAFALLDQAARVDDLVRGQYRLAAQLHTAPLRSSEASARAFDYQSAFKLGQRGSAGAEELRSHGAGKALVSE